MSEGHNQGVWIDGRASYGELRKLRLLLEMAIERHKRGELPFKYEDKAIIFTAEVVRGTLMTFHSWHFPPPELWIKESRSKEECENCFPRGFDKMPDREVWCSKLGYAYDKCPYGVETEGGVRPV